MEPLMQKIADLLQMITDTVTQMYPTLVNEATWYTVVHHTQHFLGWSLFLSFVISLMVWMATAPCSKNDEEFERRSIKIIKSYIIVSIVLAIILAIVTIFGPFLYPNINLFQHIFK